MLQAQLYFLSDQYYQDFPDDKLMKNKDTVDGVPHSRPCFFAFPDSKNSEIYWVVPILNVLNKIKSENMAAVIPFVSVLFLAGIQLF